MSIQMLKLLILHMMMLLQLIREGNIVTIFQGRSEAGPRALGNRSILFDPTIKDGKILLMV